MIDRRSFLKKSALVPGVIAGSNLNIDSSLFEDPASIDGLIKVGIDSASDLGSHYTDIRVTHSYERICRTTSQDNFMDVNDKELITVGVRSFYNGYWGFSASSVLNREEIVRLAGEAVSQARINSLGKGRDMTLSQLSVPAKGSWVMPVEINPFDIHPMDILEFLYSIKVYAEEKYLRKKDGISQINAGVKLGKQTKHFGSSDNAHYVQTTFFTTGVFRLDLFSHRARVNVPGFEAAGLGWEHIVGQPVRENLDKTIEDWNKYFKLRVKPVDVGRYDVVVAAPAVAGLVASSIGEATELDRALGFEANAGGTSYINDPERMIGDFDIGSSLLNVKADRTQHGGLGTFQWDDEGIVPVDYPVVSKGKLANMHTTREVPSWYDKGSLGNAVAEAGDYAPLNRFPNLAITSDRDTGSLDDMMGDMSAGIAVLSCSIDIDHQKSSGLGSIGAAYEVKDGKPVARLGGIGFLFKTTEFWKNLMAVGGKDQYYRIPYGSGKGEPPQVAYSSVYGLPCAFKDVSIIDVRRR